MSRYISYDDVIGRFPKSADVGSDTFVSSTYINYAEAWVDGALAPAFSVPFTSEYTTIKDLCIDYVFMKIIEFKDTKKAAMIEKSLDKRVKMLLEGKMFLTMTDGTVVGQSLANAWSATDGYAPTFGVGPIEDMMVSSSQLYDEEQARD